MVSENPKLANNQLGQHSGSAFGFSIPLGSGRTVLHVFRVLFPSFALIILSFLFQILNFSEEKVTTSLALGH